MSDAPKEVVRYEVDAAAAITQVERLKQTFESLHAAQKKGEDTSAIKGDIDQQIESLGKLGDAGKRAGDGLGELSKARRGLAQVAGAFGGETGRAISLVGELAEVFKRIGPVGTAAAAAVAVYTVAVRAMDKESQTAIASLRELESAYQRVKAEREGAQKGVEQTLGKFGAETPQNVEAAVELQQKVAKKYGREVAPDVAAMLALGGVQDVEQAAMLSEAVRRGAKLERPEQVGELQQRLEAGGAAEALRGQLAQPFTESQKLVQATAEEIGTKDVRLSAAERAHRALVKSGKLTGELVDFGKYQEFMATREQFGDVLPGGANTFGYMMDLDVGKLARQYELSRYLSASGIRPETYSGAVQSGVYEIAKARTDREELRDAGQAPIADSPLSTQAEAPAGGQVVYQTINNYNQYIQNQMNTMDPSRNTTGHPTAAAFGDLGEGN